MIRALIIEDNALSVERLTRLLAAYCQELVTVIGSAFSVPEGLRLIVDARPDLVFLDVELGGQTGFELLQALGRIDFEVVFTTGFNEYAVRAFRFGAVDFLLKPVDADELVQAVGRVVANRQHAHVQTLVQTLLHNLNPANPVKKLTIPYHEKAQPRLHIVEATQVLYFEADGSYTHVILLDGSRHLMSNPVSFYEEYLENDPNFFRAHKSYLVNLAHVKAVDQGRGGDATLINDQDIPVSYQHKKEFIRRLQGGRP